MHTTLRLACGVLAALQITAGGAPERLQTPAADTFAAITFAPRPGDVEENRRALLDSISSAAHRGARFVVLPELALTGPLQAGKTLSEPVPGPSTAAFAAAAKALHVWVAFSLAEDAGPAGEYYITTVLLDDQGRIARKVRKIMVRSQHEDGAALRGSFRDVIDTLDAGGLRLGIVSGDEIQVGIPRLANRGAETILIAAGWKPSETKTWESRAAALGKEYDVNLVVANRQGAPMTCGSGDVAGTGAMILPRKNEILLDSTNVSGMLIGSLSRRSPQWKIRSAAGLPTTVPTPYYQRTGAEIAELGRRLFFDTNLSSTGKVACATCHQPARSFTDGKPKGVGVYGRSTKRNVPSLVNVAFRPLLQWDGYASTLENFAKYPISGVSEMNFHYLDKVGEYLMSVPSYRAAFRSAMGVTEIQFDDVALALASYERTIISGNSPFDRFYYGGDAAALPDAARRGFKLFTGKAGCSSCHIVGESYSLFTDFEYHVTGVGYSDKAGRFDDIGLGSISTADQTGLFQTPPLRNVSETAPYMHDGSIATLRAVVEFYNRGGIASPGLDPRIQPLRLDTREMDDLVAFLKSLTGTNRYGPDGRPIGKS